MIKLFVHILAGITTLLSINQLLYSQTFYSTELYGIVKSVNGESITKAHIINLSNKTGTISNDEGMFQILANKTDIMQISSVGYKTLLYVIPNTDQVKLVKYFTISIDTINLA
ncbi:MAG: carboxypeptidase-like regulatory domain-containing protein, partial [Bacteroidales bacterium]|nr:carboxypeptidase-like regulatory domain-containing protein [Bacteroidales bacterium]